MCRSKSDIVAVVVLQYKPVNIRVDCLNSVTLKGTTSSPMHVCVHADTVRSTQYIAMVVPSQGARRRDPLPVEWNATLTVCSSPQFEYEQEILRYKWRMLVSVIRYTVHPLKC